MKKKITIRDLWLVKLRASKHLNVNSVAYKDILFVVDSALELLKENSLLKEKLFDIEQSLSEEDKINNIIDTKLNLALLSNKKEDFLEINKSINNNVWTIIIQKKFGKTPQQLLQSSNIRLDKAIKKIVNLHKEVDRFQKSNLDLSQKNLLLNKLNVDNPENLIKTGEEIQVLINLVKEKISKYNGFIVKDSIKNLHRSFNDSLQEAWGRAAYAEFQARKVQNELNILKNKLAKKKSLSSLIYERRKGRGKLSNLARRQGL